MNIDFPQNKAAQDWKKALESKLNTPEFEKLKAFLQTRKEAGAIIFPPEELIFNAFSQTAPQTTKIVILGQDPYHSVGQAHGLSFSVLPPQPTPPSLRNMIKEILSSTGQKVSGTDLTGWARQGVFLLNAVLTVEEASPASHAGQGWEAITDTAIEVVSKESPHCVFMLWGAHAGKKAHLIDKNKHLVLSSAHPSPLSAHRGFLGNEHFKKANEFLVQHGLSPIDWSATA